MYHISHDKRAQTSAQMISKGLYICLKNKNINEISVTDICIESKVSRATFYRLFDTSIDILKWSCDNTYKNMVSYIFQHSVTFEPRLAMHYMIDHSEGIEMAVQCHRNDIIQNSLQKYLSPIISELLLITKGTNMTEKEKNYLTNMFIGSMTSMLSYWIQTGRKEKEKQLHELIFTFSKILQHVSLSMTSD